MTRRRTAPPAAPAPATVTIDRSTLVAIGIVLALWWFAAAPARRPTPADERPVIAWVVRTAKSLLWIAAFAEKPPAAPQEPVAVRHELGVDGFPLVDHGRGW